MGGSAIGADLLSGYCTETCPVPIIVHRNYGLPKYAQGKNTLLVCSSHSGNTEETLDSYLEGLKRGITTIAITTGGKIKDIAKKNKKPFWRFEHNGQPRAAVGFSFGLLLNLFAKLSLIPKQDALIKETVNALKKYQDLLISTVPTVKNPTKRIAGQALGRWIAVFGADYFEPVARRWKTQINELAKAWAQFEYLPEADHNTLAGLENDEDCLLKTLALFLRGSHIKDRNNLRVKLTAESMMVAGLPIEILEFTGDSKLEEIWKAVLFGDYFAYYLAIGYGIDPTPVTELEKLKKSLSKV